MREPASITGRKNLLYKSFADHRLSFMEFDCGDKKKLIFMMQRDKNWPRGGLERKKNFYLCINTFFFLPIFFFSLYFFFFLLSV